MLVPPGGLVPPSMGNLGSAPDYPKYCDQFLMVLLATFTTALIFLAQLKQAVAILINSCKKAGFHGFSYRMTSADILLK